MQELGKELEKLRKVYNDTRKTLEEEMLCRIDMENTVQSLREELSFKDQVFQQELQETRTRRQVEISEIGKSYVSICVWTNVKHLIIQQTIFLVNIYVWLLKNALGAESAFFKDPKTQGNLLPKN